MLVGAGVGELLEDLPQVFQLDFVQRVHVEDFHGGLFFRLDDAAPLDRVHLGDVLTVFVVAEGEIKGHFLAQIVMIFLLHYVGLVFPDFFFVRMLVF